MDINTIVFSGRDTWNIPKIAVNISIITTVVDRVLTVSKLNLFLIFTSILKSVRMHLQVQKMINTIILPKFLEFFKLHHWNIRLHVGNIEEVTPGESFSSCVLRLPVMKFRPRWKYQYPILIFIQ